MKLTRIFASVCFLLITYRKESTKKEGFVVGVCQDKGAGCKDIMQWRVGVDIALIISSRCVGRLLKQILLTAV
jgi:hypothetical protein